jgi:hypothetical protein
MLLSIHADVMYLISETVPIHSSWGVSKKSQEVIPGTSFLSLLYALPDRHDPAAR